MANTWMGDLQRRQGVAMKRKTMANPLWSSLAWNAPWLGSLWVSCNSMAYSTSTVRERLAALTLSLSALCLAFIGETESTSNGFTSWRHIGILNCCTTGRVSYCSTDLVDRYSNVLQSCWPIWVEEATSQCAGHLGNDSELKVIGTRQNDKMLTILFVSKTC